MKSESPFLPDDIARCAGVSDDGEWREGCEHCLRRIAPTHGERAAHMVPPAIIAFFCEFLIEGKPDVQN